MRTGVIITARETSSRLPLKHLYPLRGTKGALEILLTELKSLEPTVALPPRSHLYESIVRANGARVFTDGFTPEGNVLDRIWRAAISAKLDRIVLVHGDSPLITLPLVTRTLGPTAPIVLMEGVQGLRPIAVTLEALESWRTLMNQQQEHPFAALRAEAQVPATTRLVLTGQARLTLDTMADVDYLRSVFDRIGDEREPEQIISIAEGLTR